MKRILIIAVMALAMAFVATGCCSWCNKSGKGCCKDSTTKCAKCSAKAADSKCAAKATDSKCAKCGNTDCKCAKCSADCKCGKCAAKATAPVVAAPAAPAVK